MRHENERIENRKDIIAKLWHIDINVVHNIEDTKRVRYFETLCQEM